MKAVYALIGASLLMIAFGLYLILQQPPPEEVQDAQPEAVQAPEEEPEEQPRDIALVPVPAEEAERDGEIPQLEVEAEPGSEEWCEQMMNQSNDRWSRDDSQTFADQCIYE
ncbi:DUF3012 domain-containing protein [Marinimicrobium sp. C2-29]|uniref:DUF3012 domain-containing protein n=1 Tax=Marinimicrobium sp. C2-29 TaxID=3139825 RepID=UPI0031394DD9